MSGNYAQSNTLGFSKGTMAEYDALPPSIRELFRNARISYSTKGWPERVALLGEQQAFRRIQGEMLRHQPILAREAYGPDHPQAQ